MDNEPLTLWGEPIYQWYRAAFALIGFGVVSVVVLEGIYFLVIHF